MQKSIFLLLLIFTLSAQAFSQSAPKARKFDEFIVDWTKTTMSDEFSQRTERLVQQLRKEPKTTKAVIFEYGSRIVFYERDLKSKREASGIYYINSVEFADRMIGLDGGIREKKTYEFWIVPKNAGMPVPTPQYQSSEVVYCPQFDIWGDSFAFERNVSLDFSAKIWEDDTYRNLNYEWAVSGGEIIAGQGSEKIKVDISSATDEHLKVGLVIEGFPFECENQSFQIVKVGQKPFKYSEFAGPSGYTKSVLDGLTNELQRNSLWQSKIYIYAPRGERLAYAERGVAFVKRYLTIVRGVSLERISVEVGGYRDSKNGVIREIWIYPPNVNPPLPNPSADTIYGAPQTKNKK